MALGTLVVVPEGVHGDVVPGAYKEVYIQVTGDGAYPAPGGYTFGLAQLQALVPVTFIRQIEVVSSFTAGTTGLLAVYNNATGKLQAFGTGSAVSTAFSEATAAEVTTSMVAVLKVIYR